MSTKAQIKNTGATFTPPGLASFLAEKISGYLKNEKQSILDPACGDGELLVSIGDKLEKLGVNFSLTGYDDNAIYLNKASERMVSFGMRDINLIEADFLKAVDLSNQQMNFGLDKTKRTSRSSTFDIIIANPPYVRTQIMGAGKAQMLSRKFNLNGRIDLYYPFLIAMTASLRYGGIIGVITSNRYLSTKSGESVRKFLSENYEILEVIDLGDTKLFDAAVLPAIFIGRKSKDKKSSIALFTKVYEDLNDKRIEYEHVDNFLISLHLIIPDFIPHRQKNILNRMAS